MITIEKPEVKFALDAVKRASLLVKHIQKEMVTPALTKGDRSPVTVADFASQALVSALLQKAFPNDPLVAEETSKALQLQEEKNTLAQVTKFVRESLGEVTSEQVCNWIDNGAASPASRFWTLDPIDGTKGFLRGDQYAIAFALIVEGKVQIGVLGCPNLTDGYQPDFGGKGSLVVAVRGEGTWVTPLIGKGQLKPLLVSKKKIPSQARILRSFESGHTNVNQIELFAQALGIKTEPVRMDSQAKYAVLAAGHGELILRLLSPTRPDYREKIWDQAAGALVVEEAGGKVTDLNGQPLDFTTGRTLKNNRGICASNSYLHDAAIDVLRKLNA